jgi:hypothetical protein
MLRFPIALAAILLYTGIGTFRPAVPQQATPIPLVSFQSPSEAEAWRTVNDGVMGGRSSGGSLVVDGQFIFSGVINTSGGGFSSVRRAMVPGALEGAEAIILVLKPDARSYRLIARTNARFMGRPVSYQAPIPQSPAGEWSTVRVPVSDFSPSVFGRQVPASRFSPADVSELGFIIADKRDGEFTLQVRSIGMER